ncbi:YgiQ family radical SAM protein [Laedolimicola intestinihominis]|mgnify:CR=1 FL=1|uniref:YgiQ family radical SAM protein n=1 Tax=Laedolimicola intestinihominis TaxID=3133166 RepID=A0ABV1FJY3_9FIRM
MKQQGFLPATKEELRERGITQPDFVYVIGDAYVDHPSFGPAIIGRVLESHGYSVAILAQPDWKDPKSIQVYGEPRLAFLVSSGNMDSMVNHYSVSKKRRKTDAFTPGGVMGKRPDRADMVYSNLIRHVYKHVPIILGGIEASLRRMAHYDYWADGFKRSLLLDSGADLISYGMGERSIVEIADALASGISIRDLTFVNGTVYKTSHKEDIYDAIFLPDYESMKADKTLYAKSFGIQQKNADPIRGKRMAEQYSEHLFIVQNPPAKPLSQEEMDEIYDLPFQRAVHPSCLTQGEVPAFSEIKFSLASCRGCFGACSFCALTFHQGRIIQARSHESLLREARAMTKDKDFKGYIHDVGGPTADFRQPACDKQLKAGACPERQCLFPKPCPNLKADHSDYISLLRKLRAIPGVKKVFIRSGIRFDYVLADPNQSFLKELCEYHVSGQLKVAPEHVSDAVLSKMGKPNRSVYEEFCRRYKKMNETLQKKQYLVPYLMSSHPGSTLKEAVELAEYCRDLGYMPEQVQDFYPTPSTMSTCMYYTGLDPRTMEKVYVPKNPHEKAMQRALIQYRDPKNRELVQEALEKCGRRDLIGYGPKCLLRPEGGRPGERSGQKTDFRKNSSGNRAGGRTERTETNVRKNAGAKKKTIRNVHKKK